MTADSAAWLDHKLDNGRFHIVQKLGEGGMGFVYRATDNVLESEVVIKVPRRAMLDDPEFKARFARENRALVRLQHPHIVSIIYVGEHEGLPYAVMQFLAGGDLKMRQQAAGGALPPMDLQNWLTGIADALDFIHEEGFIHRDVKPANILFDARGNVFLSDFGVAKVVAENVKEGASLTGTGMVLGTPEYMAPELVMGEQFDARIDQYALAVTVYEIICGRVPFEGPTPASILVKQTTEEVPPLSAVNPTIPANVSDVVMAGLAKSPDYRYPNCRAFADAVLFAVTQHASQMEVPQFHIDTSGGGGTVSAAAAGTQVGPPPRTAQTGSGLKSLLLGKTTPGQPLTDKQRMMIGLRLTGIVVFVVFLIALLAANWIKVAIFIGTFGARLAAFGALQWAGVFVMLIAGAGLAWWVQTGADKKRAKAGLPKRKGMPAEVTGALVGCGSAVFALVLFAALISPRDLLLNAIGGTTTVDLPDIPEKTSPPEESKTDEAKTDDEPVVVLKTPEKSPKPPPPPERKITDLPIAAHADGRQFVNSLGMTMVGISAGRFRSESNAKEWAEVPETYWIANSEVTVAQYLFFAQQSSSYEEVPTADGEFTRWLSGWEREQRELFPVWLRRDSDDFVKNETSPYHAAGTTLYANAAPITGITFDQMQRFCDWLSRNATEPLTYRLPTREEWVCAYRAGTESEHYWGADFDALKLNGSGKQDNFEFLARTQQFDANAWGLYDMAGNVWEAVTPRGLAKGGAWKGTGPHQYAVEGTIRFDAPGPEFGFRVVGVLKTAQTARSR